MRVSTIVATPGFLNLDGSEPFTHRAMQVLEAMLEVDCVVGDPTLRFSRVEDDNRTARIPFAGTERVYAKIDGAEHTPEEWAAQGHPEYPILTFLVATEH